MCKLVWVSTVERSLGEIHDYIHTYVLDPLTHTQ